MTRAAETVCVVVPGTGGLIGLFRSDLDRINETLRIYNEQGYRMVQFTHEVESSFLRGLLQTLCLIVTLFLWCPATNGLLFFERQIAAPKSSGRALRASSASRGQSSNEATSSQLTPTPGLWTGEAPELQPSEEILHEFALKTAAAFPGNRRFVDCHCVVTNNRLLVIARNGQRQEVLFDRIADLKLAGDRSRDIRVEVPGGAFILYGGRESEAILAALVSGLEHER